MSIAAEPGAHDSGRRRAFAFIVLAALLVAGGLIDRIDRPEPASQTTRVGMPAAAPPGALSSTWFCPGATSAGDGGAAEGFVVIANPRSSEVTGTVTVHPTEGEARSVPLTVAGFATAQLRYSELATAPWAAVTVEVSAGEVAVEQVVSGPLGWSAAPCASQAGQTWHFAGGSTSRLNNLYVTLYNPFPDDAIVDLSFATNEGSANPQAFRGVVVRGRSLWVLSIGEHVRRRDDVATTVTARRGRLVAAKVQTREEPIVGLTWALGLSDLSDSYTFPEGYLADGVAERLNFYNPSRREVVVDVEMVLDEGVAEPWEIRIPPGDRAVLDFAGEERVPRNVAHALLVRSLDGAPFAVEQWVGAAPPSARRGSEELTGSSVTAREWVFAAGAATDTWDEWIIVQNMSTEDATLDIVALAAGQQLAIDGLQAQVVPAGARVGFRLGDHISRPDLGLLVRSDQLVVVERAMFSTSGIGLSSSIGVPLGVRGR